MTESPVISNDRATFSRGQSMKRTGRHVLKAVAQQGRWLNYVPVLPSQQGKNTHSLTARGQPARHTPSASSSLAASVQAVFCTSYVHLHAAMK